MNMRPHRFFAITCLSLALALLPSCGRKTEPLTPDSPRPEEAKEVKVAVRDNVAFLSWRIPVKNVEGKDMGPAWIEAFRIYRAEIDRDRRKPRYKAVADVFLANPAPAEVRNGAVTWRDTSLQYGRVYGYRIKAESAKGGASKLSEEVRITPLLSLAPPRNVTAAGGDSSVMLTWDPVTTRMDGSKHQGFVGYNIYRGPEKGQLEEAPLNKDPARTTSYKDLAVANDKTYYYIVRSVDSPSVPWKESLDSSLVSATPRDATPPERPEGLTVVPGVGRVFLTWNENGERDLAGYYVYRSLKSGKDYERLTMDKPLNRTTYSDENVKPRTTYYYIITAVDQSGNESARSKEQKAYAERRR
jgi:fibronectin type 3 domain-containing protein